MEGQKKDTKRPLLLFIVEGKSDHTALENPINCLLDEHGLQDVQIDFCECNGDLTAEFRSTPDKLLLLLDEKIRKHFAKQNTYTLGDVSAVIWLCDADGAFIPDEDCHPYDDAHRPPRDIGKRFLYMPNGIYGDSAQEIIDRNRRKTKNMEKLSVTHSKKGMGKKEGVPLWAYYFSTNLDHFLHDERNLPPFQKNSKAGEFARRPDKALQRLRSHPMCVSAALLMREGLLAEDAAGDPKEVYKSSWKYLEQGRNSIKRHSNLNLLLDELVKAGEQPDEQPDETDK